MVQLVIGLLHAREQSSTKRLPLVCQRWQSRCGDGVVITYSTKDNAHGHFLYVFALVCLFLLMPHLAGVLDDGTDNCSIYIDEIMGVYACSLEQDNEMWCGHVRSCDIVTTSRRMQFTCSICVSFVVIGGMSVVCFLEAYAHFIRLIIVQCHFVGGSLLCHVVCRCAVLYV